MREIDTDQCENDQTVTTPIVLYAEPTPVSGGVEWRLGFSNPPLKGAVSIDLPHKTPGRDIEFNLVGNLGFIRFDTTDPIWVHNGQKCPPPKLSKDPQISVKSVSDKQLTIYDRNDGPKCTLTYQLNFIGAQGLDPEIKNGGNQ